ncbi:MAG: DUF167 domain-containing protein [Victivallaceae bacterium]
MSDIITEHQADCIIHCWIQPRASKTAIVGLHDGSLKISLAAPPVDGQANAELCKFLAKKLNLAKSAVKISAGDSSRRKSVKIEGIAKALLMDKLKLCM